MTTTIENRQSFAHALPSLEKQHTGWFWYESFEGKSEALDPLACVAFWNGMGGLSFEQDSQSIAQQVQSLAEKHQGKVIRNTVVSPVGTFPLRGMTIQFGGNEEPQE